MLLAAVLGPIAIGTSVWIIGRSRWSLNICLCPLGQVMVRGAFGGFPLQGVVLFGQIIALRPITGPAEVKALVAAGLGSFGVVCAGPGAGGDDGDCSGSLTITPVVVGGACR